MTDKEKGARRIALFEAINAKAQAAGTPVKLISKEDTEYMKKTERTKPTILIDEATGKEIGIAKTTPETANQLAFIFNDEGSATISEQIVGYDANEYAAEADVPLWIWHDQVIFNDEVKATFLDLTPAERPRFVVDTLDKFYANNTEYANFSKREIYQDPMMLLEFFKSITRDDLDSCEIRATELRQTQLEKLINVAELAIERQPIDLNKVATFWPIFQIRDLFTESEMAALYYHKFPRGSSKKKANNANVIMTTGGRLADISNKDFSGWLDEIPNPTAYLSYVGPHYWDEIETDDGGNIYEGDEARVLRAVRDQDEKIKKSFKNGSFGEERPPEHERINKEVLRALFNATIEEHGGIRTIYLPTFARELNENYKIDVDEYDENGELNEKGRQNKSAAEQRAKDAAEARANGEKVYTKEKPSIMQQFYSLDYWAGVLDNNDVMRTAVLVGINQEAQTIDVVLPYLDKIRRKVKEARELEAEQHKRAYLMPAYNALVHSNIGSERNKLAVDLVYTIIDKLLQRGSKPNSAFKEYADQGEAGDRVIFRIKYKTLIESTPLLYMAYKNANGSKREYDVLNRTFKKAFQLLHTKTDIYKYFVDLKIPETPPTKRTLNDNLVITHNGRNKDYKGIK